MDTNFIEISMFHEKQKILEMNFVIKLIRLKKHFEMMSKDFFEEELKRINLNN